MLVSDLLNAMHQRAVTMRTTAEEYEIEAKYHADKALDLRLGILELNQHITFVTEFIDGESKSPASPPAPDSEVASADPASTGEAALLVASPDTIPAIHRIEGEEVERTHKREEVFLLHAANPKLTPDEAAARLNIPVANLRIFTQELEIAWSAPPSPPIDVSVGGRGTLQRRVQLVHEAHPTWTSHMVANYIGAKETSIRNLLTEARRQARAAS